MKTNVIIWLLAVTLLAVTGTALAQQQNPVPSREKQTPRPAPKPTPAGARDFGIEKQNCPCEIVGTWKAQISKDEARLYEFDGEGVVKVLKVVGNTKPAEIATAKYEFVEEPMPMESAAMESAAMESAAAEQKAPDKKISFTATGKDRIFGRTKATMKIVSFNDSSLTCEIPGVKEPVRWTRVDPDRYFIILVARKDEFYDKSGSAFPLVVKLAGGATTINAAGTYSNHGKAAFGTVPSDFYKEYLRDSRSDAEVILRVEINSQQYARALKVVQEWQRRAREGALLYRSPDNLEILNNILLIRDVTATLNLCQDDLNLYQLDYNYPRDWISEAYSSEFIPFYFFQELRRRNEARHIDYKKFQELVPMPNLAIR